MMAEGELVMRITESVLLGTLKQGGCVRTFWRRSARLAGSPAPEFSDGVVLETPGESGDTPLSHVDFTVARKWLVAGRTGCRSSAQSSSAVPSGICPGNIRLPLLVLFRRTETGMNHDLPGFNSPF